MKSKPFSRPYLNLSDAFYGSSGSLATQWLQHYDTKLSGHVYTPKQYLAWLQVLLAGDAGAWAKTCSDIAHLLAESTPTQQTVTSFTSLFCIRFQSLEEQSVIAIPVLSELPEQPVISEKPVIPKQPTLQLPEQPVIPQSAPSVPEQPTPQLPEPAPELPKQPTIPQLSELSQQPTPQVPEKPITPEQPALQLPKPTLQLPEQPLLQLSQQPITSILPQQLPQPDFTFTLTHLTQQSVTTPHYWFWPIMRVG